MLFAENLELSVGNTMPERKLSQSQGKSVPTQAHLCSQALNRTAAKAPVSEEDTRHLMHFPSSGF